MDLGLKINPSTVLLDASKRTDTNKRESIEKTAEQFESFLVYSMLKEFGKAMNVTKKSYAEQTQMSLFYEKIGEFVAKKGIGIKDMIARYTERGAKVLHGNGEKR
jgi:Rod binding domain-containing protein